MKWTPMAAVPLAVLVVPVQATEYLTVQQAQAQMFPGASFQAVPLQITDQIRETLNERSGVHEPFNDKGVWKVSTGGWFIVVCRGARRQGSRARRRYPDVPGNVWL